VQNDLLTYYEKMFSEYPDVVNVKTMCKMLGGISTKTGYRLLKDNKLAYTNFLNMSLSVKKTYTRAYFDAKTDAGRVKRLTWMIERLEKNLKPMS